MTASNAAQIVATANPQALVLRSLLTSAIDVVGNVVERRASIPILSNVRLLGDGTQMFVTGTDLDVEVTVAVPSAADSRFAVTLCGHKLKDLLHKATAGDYVGLTMPDIEHFEATPHSAERDEFDGRVPVDFEKVRYNIAGIPVTDFPEITHDMTACSRFTLPGDTLHDAFGSVMGAISTEETRYYLNGVYLHAIDAIDGRKLRMVATDGHRLYMRDLAAPDGCFDIAPVILPRGAVALLHKLTKGKAAPESVEVEMTGTAVRFSYADGDNHVTITSKVIDGSFPEYQRVIPTENDKRLTIDSAELAEAVRAVSLISDDRGRAIKFDLAPGNCRLSVNSLDNGSNESTVKCGYSSDPLEIGFNARYVAEILKVACPDGGDVVAKLADPGAPMVITGTRDGWLAVLMPMRV